MIKKTLLGFLVLLALLIIGCNNEPGEVPLEDREYDVDMLDVSVEAETESAWKCDLGKLYYLKKKFIYHINDNDMGVVDSPVGEYSQAQNKTRGWTLRMYLNRNDSVYTDNIDFILNGQMPNGDPVECVETQMIPRQFENFIGSHYHLFENVTVDKLEQRDEAYLH